MKDHFIRNVKKNFKLNFLTNRRLEDIFIEFSTKLKLLLQDEIFFSNKKAQKNFDTSFHNFDVRGK